MNFVPDEKKLASEIDVPYFEDATTARHGVHGQSTSKTLDVLQAEIRSAIGLLGGSVQAFVPGTFVGKRKRYGYELHFELSGQEGRIRIAALPLKSETETKKRQALKQALYTVREQLVAQYNMLLLSPGGNPLLPYLLIDGKTVAEVYEERFAVPMLSSGTAIVEGEVVK